MEYFQMIQTNLHAFCGVGANSCCHFFFDIQILQILCVIPAYSVSSKQNPSWICVQGMNETLHVSSFPNSSSNPAVMLLQRTHWQLWLVVC